MADALVSVLLEQLRVSVQLPLRSVIKNSYDALAFRVDPEYVLVWLLDTLALLVIEPSQTLLRRNLHEYEQITDPFHKLYRAASLGDKDEFLATLPATNGENSFIQLISQPSPLKNTFLHIALSYGHENLAIEIVNLHRPLLFEKNFQGDTALHIAAKGGRRGMVGSLLGLIAETTQSSVTSDGETIDIENNMWLLEMKNDEGNTALHEALINDHEGVACQLVNTDPYLSFTANNEQKSPLYLATEAGFLSIVELMLLINRVADQNSTSSIGKSPLHVAIRHRNKVVSSPEMAKEFLKTHEASFSNRPHMAAVDYLTYGSADFSFPPYGPYWKFMKKLCMSELLGGRTLDQLLQ